MLAARNRLRTGADFSAVTRARGGARAGSRLLVVHANQTDSRAVRPPRVGFVVSKAVGGAVIRNRVKRRLRALMATRLPLVPAGVDLVVRAQPAAADLDSSALGTELDRLLGQALARVVPAQPFGVGE
ncbi:MAG: ribonuclease P protein component [Intrasporangiaceae bacterium]|nr:ribonuclease P protein component [Intrasporangiaceae bacterium]